MIKYICSKCGKSIELDDDYTDTDDKYEQEWDAEQFHMFSIPYVGYGSSFDGCNGEFTLCDDCLYELVDSFTAEGKEKVWIEKRLILVNTYTMMKVVLLV